ncbi:transcriptional regulator [Paractinoplanes hotanensis]|uniref:Transcriptional regulator n=1 Tax=Paractinoplanes hotanensis TaxID=2906497 RepID=A0ABT0Y8N7_9ACTN|nr:transcriptional regulator [Actinoplanes hotanensis]MCM4081649.1 transcriptional regulator [Actinoplanes hotanensis]
MADAAHERVRLGLQEVRRAEFGYLRTSWEVTVSNLAEYLGALKWADLIEVERAERTGALHHRRRQWNLCAPMLPRQWEAGTAAIGRRAVR